MWNFLGRYKYLQEISSANCRVKVQPGTWITAGCGTSCIHLQDDGRNMFLRTAGNDPQDYMFVTMERHRSKWRHSLSLSFFFLQFSYYSHPLSLTMNHSSPLLFIMPRIQCNHHTSRHPYLFSPFNVQWLYCYSHIHLVRFSMLNFSCFLLHSVTYQSVKCDKMDHQCTHTSMRVVIFLRCCIIKVQSFMLTLITYYSAIPSNN